MKEKGYSPEVLKGLTMRYALGKETGAIVRAAGSAVRFLAPGTKSGLQKSQITNVVAVAAEAPCVEVITNFLRYQIGRSRPKETWQYRGFGLQVIKDIEDEEGPVTQAARRVAKVVAERLRKAEHEADEKELCRDAYLELTRLYLGYLSRCFVYGYETGGWEDFHKVKEVCEDV